MHHIPTLLLCSRLPLDRGEDMQRNRHVNGLHSRSLLGHARKGDSENLQRHARHDTE